MTILLSLLSAIGFGTGDFFGGLSSKRTSALNVIAFSHAVGLVGVTAHRVLRDQFRRLRDGDRYWYRAYLGSVLADFVEQQTLAVIIKRNTSIGSELPADIWHAAP